jgi:ribonuclease Z
VFSGVSGPSDEVAELARGADVMVCMCWDRQSAMVASGEGEGNTMLGTTQAGVLAARADVETLVLSHINAHLDSPGVREDGIRDVAAVFDGTVVFGEELSSFAVGSSSAVPAP